MTSFYLNAEQTAWLTSEAQKADEKPQETLRLIVEKAMTQGIPTEAPPVEVGKTVSQMPFGQTLSGKSILGR